jgi:uncharacterized membrane protein
MRPIVQILISLLILSVTAGTALAQDSGGSMGGGSWDSGGGGGGGDWSSSDSSSSSWDSGSSSSSSGSSGGGNLGGAEVLVVLIFGAIGLAITMMKQQGSSLSSGIASYSPDTTEHVDVTVIRVGLDARVRPYAQKELARIAKVADTGTPQGLVLMLNEVGLMLRRLRDAWVYGGAHNQHMAPMGSARQDFQQQVARARATFRHETIRNSDGHTTEAAAVGGPRRSEEGPGIVLVTLIVAARQELFTVDKIGDGDDLRRALEVLSALTSHSLVATEIVWTPAAEDDRMSSVELEALLPGAVFPIHGAMVGKVVCTYCSGPFPAELLSCPHCGAPARDLAA